MSVPDRLCAATANAQFGVISRQQAHAAGLSDKGILHRVATGRWQRVLPHVYRIVGAPESWHQKLMAAVLWAGEGSAISHRSAAAMWGLDGARRERIEVSAIHKLTRPGSWPIPHRPARLPLDEVTTISGIAVTTVARTLLDLGAVVLLPAVERALDGALRDGLVHVKELRTVLDRHGTSGRDGTAALRALLVERDPDYVPPESDLERDYRRIFQNGGLPDPVRQYPVPNGSTFYRIDFAYPEARLAIEVDSYKYHSGRQNWQKDKVRSNVLVAQGWRVLHFTKEDKKNPRRVVAEVESALRAAGFYGQSEAL
jgi:hypothetical protein